MTPEISTLLALVAAGILLIAGGAYWWINRPPQVDREESEPLPLFGALTPAERMRSPAAPRPAVSPVAEAARPSVSTPAAGRTPAGPRGEPPAPAAAPVAAPVFSAPLAPPQVPERPAPVIREFVTQAPPATSVTVPPVAVPSAAAAAPELPRETSPTVAASAPVTAPEHGVVSAAGVPGTMVEGHALRFSVPAEGTLQFLPGRFEIGSGLDAGREIRFVRVEGPQGIEVTFGRAEGELYRHIQLRDKTVSRAHAVMRFRDGVWHLQNLSHTNPVVHNGIQMADASILELADGDRVEMGEVLFTYRSR